MTPFQRRVALYGVLVSCLAGAVWLVETGASESTDISKPVSVKALRRDPSASQVPAGAGASSLPLDRLSRTFVTVDDTNPFGVRSWQVAAPPPPAPVAVVAAPPTAPPLPFTFAGKLELDGGKRMVYLMKGEQSFGVTKGETFDGVYRLDGIEKGNLVIVYLPLASKQLLPIGSENGE